MFATSSDKEENFYRQKFTRNSGCASSIRCEGKCPNFSGILLGDRRTAYHDFHSVMHTGRF